MRLYKFKVPNDFNLFLHGDAHKYVGAHSKKGYKLLVDSVNSEFEGLPESRNYLIDMGDFADLIPIRHKYYDPKYHKATPLEQIARYVKESEPIIHKLLFLLDSTHPQMLRDIGNVTEYVCEQLQKDYKIKRESGSLYATQTAKAEFISSRETRIFKLYATHGSKTINSIADDDIRIDSNMALILKRHLRKKASDCAIMAKGHAHKLIVQAPKPKLCQIDNGKKLIGKYPNPSDFHALEYIPEEMRWYVNTGSFLRSQILDYSTYAEKREYDPVDLGFAVVMVRDRKIVDVKRITLGV